jgi:epoxide hydrolase 4
VEVKKREFRNLKTSWIEAGKPANPLLVFLHGFPDNAETWEFQIEAFKESFHVLCPFTRGTYPSDPAEDRQRYSSGAEALDILQLLQTKDPEHTRPIILVGHDMGVPVAWRLSNLLGKRLKGLVILNGLSLGQMAFRLKKRPRQLLKSWYVFPMLVPYFPEFAFGHFAAPLLRLVEKRGGFPGPKSSPEDHAQKNILRPLNQYREFTKEILNFRMGDIQKVHASTLVMWSNRDNYLIHPTLEELEPFASHVTVRILDGHHWVHHSNPEMVNEILKDFFEDALKEALP